MTVAVPAFGELDYLVPATLAEAAALFVGHGAGARLLAGGQTLIPEIYRAGGAIAAIIDLGGLSELSVIDWSGRHVAIGAMVTIAAARRALATAFPVVESCFGRVGNHAVRNRATIGGSVALADSASEVTAFLLAYDAELLLAGPSEATLPIAAMLDEGLPPGFLIRAIRVPLPPLDESAGFAEILRRRSGGRSLAMAIARRHGGRARLVFSGGEHGPVGVEGPDGSALLAEVDRRTAAVPMPVRAWIAAAARRALAEADGRPC
jgi:carbon-monoxide dehydrogenase medium subunit